MALKKLADDTVAEINNALSAELSEADCEKISRIVEKSLIEAVNKATQSYNSATVVCCGPEADIAHKIAEEVDRAQNALFGNLISLR